MSSNYHNPVRHLRSILQNEPTPNKSRLLPFSELDALYAYVLKTAADQLGDLETITQIAGLCVLYAPYLYWMEVEAPTTVFAKILNVDAEDVTSILEQLSSIILHTSKDVSVYHAYFSEFLFDRKRSGKIWVDERALLSLVKCPNDATHSSIDHFFI